MSALNQHKTLDYLQGLNGIRALSAFLVIGTHWPNNLLALKFGWMGVNIFFVLSGFLITRILLVEKQKPLKHYLSDFYYKRALRIFPLYYLFLLVASTLVLLISINFPELLRDDTWKDAYAGVTKDMPYYLTYTYNLKINLSYFLGWENSSNLFFGHLWSLAVEEQFYMIFPFVVFFASLRNLKKIIIGILIICPLIRLWAALYGVSMVTDKYWLGELLYSNTLCQADALAAGAALAVFKIKVKRPYLVFFISFALWLIVGLVHFYLLRKSGYFLVEGKSLGYNFPGFWFMQPTPYFLVNIRAVYLYSLVNLLAITLILPATLKQPLFPGFFTNPIVDYLGKISYGIYVFHSPLVAILLICINKHGGLAYLTANPLIEIGLFIVYCISVISLAHLSFHYFERKLILLKNRNITK